jgi:hypothetical protein
MDVLFYFTGMAATRITRNRAIEISVFEKLEIQK